MMHFILNLTTQAAYSSAGITSISSRLRRSQRFCSVDEAMEHFRHQYRISMAEQEAIVRGHLGRVLREENGGPSPPRIVDQGQDLVEEGITGGWIYLTLMERRLNGMRA